MPDRLIICKQIKGNFGKIINKFSKITGLPLLKTGDDAYDAEVKTIGFANEAFPWLISQHKKAIIDFLSKNNCVISQKSEACSLHKTCLKLKYLEDTFSHLIEAQSK